MHRSIHLRASRPIELLLLHRHSVFPQTKCASCRQPGCSNECISLKQGYCSSFNIYLSDLSWLSAHCAAEHRTPIFLHIHTRQTGWQMSPLIMRYSSIQFDKKRNDALCKPSQLGWGNPTGNKSQGWGWAYAHKTAVCMEGCGEWTSAPPTTSASVFLSPFCADRPSHKPVQ